MRYKSECVYNQVRSRMRYKVECAYDVQSARRMRDVLEYTYDISQCARYISRS